MPPSPPPTPIINNREQDVAWRERTRKEDLEFRDSVQRLYFNQRRKESSLENRRYAVAAAAALCSRETPVSKLLGIAEEVESWIRQPGKTDGSPD